MTEPMDRRRFDAILDAYGAEPRRWPERERDAALALLRTDETAADLLEGAGALDDLLYAARVPAPTPALALAVVEGAPRRPVMRRARLWWSAVALGLAGAGGALAGSAATASLRPVPLVGYEHEAPTAFGDLGLGESE